MLLIFLTFSLILSISFAYSLRPEESSLLWAAWKSIHNKNYHQEESLRFSIFKENYQKIISFNADPENHGVKFALNKFADLTSEEFAQIYLGYTHQYPEQNDTLIQRFDPAPLPVRVDWRQKNIVTPVKDQSRCGACWAFSAVGALESLYAIKTSNLNSFSEQQLIDCDEENYGCGGGLIHKAFEYTAKNGLENQKDYPYIAHDQKCRYNHSKAIQINAGWSFVPPKDAIALKTAVMNMPVSVAIDADQDLFQFYSSGVIMGNCRANLNHAVLVVGYDMIDGKEAWIVKNSWSSAWGNAGYVYLSTNDKVNRGAGVCGILSQPVVPN